MRSFTAPAVSTPANPPPATTTVSTVLRIGLIRQVVRHFQKLDGAVAHEDGVAQRLHRQGMLFETGCAVEVRHRADRQHDLVVGDFERASRILS